MTLGRLKIAPVPYARAVLSADQDFEWFFRAQYPAVVRTCRLIVHERGRAEELAQDAFVQLYRHWRKVSRYESPEAWVRRVAIRMSARFVRRERIRSVLEREGTVTITQDQRDVDLEQALAKLPTNQRAAVVLHYFEDRPAVEIAHILGCAEATARVHLHRARRRLAELLGEEVPDVD
jgi:RNA polymerase sigma-70 factor (ECF subfamily)